MCTAARVTRPQKRLQSGFWDRVSFLPSRPLITLRGVRAAKNRAGSFAVSKEEEEKCGFSSRLGGSHRLPPRCFAPPPFSPDRAWDARGDDPADFFRDRESVEALRATLTALDGQCRGPAAGPGPDLPRGCIIIPSGGGGGGGGGGPPEGQPLSAPFPLQKLLGRPPRGRFDPYGAGGDADFVDPPTPELNGLQVGRPHALYSICWMV